jgi:hypothetical protein
VRAGDTMTFEQWWESHPELDQAKKQTYVHCWNVALEVVCRTKFTRQEYPPPVGLPQEICEQIRALQVSSIAIARQLRKKA